MQVAASDTDVCKPINLHIIQWRQRCRARSSNETIPHPFRGARIWHNHLNHRQVSFALPLADALEFTVFVLSPDGFDFPGANMLMQDLEVVIRRHLRIPM